MSASTDEEKKCTADTLPSDEQHLLLMHLLSLGVNSFYFLLLLAKSCWL
jgi:hypothetical protein